MSGFPARPSRSAFGPSLVDQRPVTQPDRELGADQMNLTFWQTAGASRVLPMAVLIYNGATQARVHQALAFDPDGELGNVPAVKLGTGSYRFTFASTYKNQLGVSVAYAPRAAFAMVQGSAAQVQAVCTVSGQDVTVTVQNGSNAATDATFILFVW